jgi:2-keto-4-pentenoate hydratase/2-oxohepta-3-ene-1,7-dioic acid hydratase in catechol pathway
MRIVRFALGVDPRFGIVDDTDIVVLAGDPLFSGLDTTGERVPLDAVRLLAPVIPRSKVIGVAGNYPTPAADGAPPREPVFFLMPNTAVVGPGDAIRVPPAASEMEHEGELVVVIGSIAKQVAAADYADVVFGYTVGNDVTARDLLVADGTFARAKGHDTFAPLGPWIETELDPTGLTISTSVDGVPERSASTSAALRSVGELVEAASDIWTLLPGDVIFTGAPAGPGDFAAGQTIDITIDGIGTLSNPSRPR